MFKSIVIEGGDGVGKSTLAKHLASNITENLDGYEAFYARFPSNGVSGFREFFLNQKGSKPSIKNQQLVWSDSYQSSVPPITNLMHIMADFYYVYSVIPASPDVHAIRERGNTPVLIIDRELLSTIVYQIMHPFSQGRGDTDAGLAQQQYMLDLLGGIVRGSETTNFAHDLLIHLGPENGEARMRGNDVFDNYDQPKIQRQFVSLCNVIKGKASTLDHLVSTGHFDWLKERFPTLVDVTAFSKPSVDLAQEITELFNSKQPAHASN